MELAKLLRLQSEEKGVPPIVTINSSDIIFTNEFIPGFQEMTKGQIKTVGFQSNTRYRSKFIINFVV